MGLDPENEMTTTNEYRWVQEDEDRLSLENQDGQEIAFIQLEDPYDDEGWRVYLADGETWCRCVAFAATENLAKAGAEAAVKEAS